MRTFENKKANKNLTGNEQKKVNLKGRKHGILGANKQPRPHDLISISNHTVEFHYGAITAELTCQLTLQTFV